jgi:hypothetical protein
MAIGPADDCVIRQNPITRDGCLEKTQRFCEKRCCYSCVKQHSQTCIVSERSGPRCQIPPCYWYIESTNSIVVDANVFLALSGEIAFFAVELVVLEGEESELRSLFIAISRSFEDNHVLGLGAGRRAHDPFHLRLGHAVRDLIVVSSRQLRTGQRAIAAGAQHK